MIQITPNFVIGLPDRPTPEEWNKFVTQCNQRRLKAMQDFGMDINEYSEEAFKIFKEKRNEIFNTKNQR